MAKRFAAASGLALAAALLFAAPAKAQGFFSFYEMSPRQIVGMLADDGYELRGPMVRRGDVYVADVSSVSGRTMRLIVSARDGRVIERFASEPRAHRYDDEEDVSRVARSPRYGDDEERDSPDRSDRPDRSRRNQMALGDLFNPPSRVYGNDSLFGSKPTPPAAIPDESTSKPKRHVVKKHKDTYVARAPAVEAPKSETAKPADTGSSVAAVAPNSSPEPKKPAVDAVKPVEVAKPAVATPKPTPTPETAQAKVDEKRATAEPAPAPAPVKKVEPARKKLNDLPVGTLD